MGPLTVEQVIFEKGQNQSMECECSRFKVQSCALVMDENTYYYDGFKSVSISG